MGCTGIECINHLVLTVGVEEFAACGGSILTSMFRLQQNKLWNAARKIII